MKLRVSLLLVSGLILLFHSNLSQAAYDPCGDGFGERGDATLCFDNHTLLRWPNRRADNGVILGRGYIQKNYLDYSTLIAIALLNEGQACAVKFSPKAFDLYTTNGRVNARFLDRMIEPIKERIANVAKDDCVIEVHLFQNNKSGYAIVDFVTQSAIDGVSDGIMVVDFDQKPAKVVKDILYIKHLEKKDFSKLIWGHPAFRLLANNVLSHEVYQLASTGFVTKQGAGIFNATYIFDNKNYKTFRVCSQAEMIERHANPQGALLNLLELSDTELAIRAIPGTWHQQLTMDPTAYVLCN